jgi:hypothetical protein
MSGRGIARGGLRLRREYLGNDEVAALRAAREV